LIKRLAHQNREWIPERVVHAKGWGAHGTFKIAADIVGDTDHAGCPASLAEGRSKPARRPRIAIAVDKNVSNFLSERIKDGFQGRSDRNDNPRPSLALL
jgi:hypothetical protein